LLHGFLPAKPTIIENLSPPAPELAHTSLNGISETKKNKGKIATTFNFTDLASTVVVPIFPVLSPKFCVGNRT
jgi:hypothetical protein